MMLHRILQSVFLGIVVSLPGYAQTTISGDIHTQTFDTTGSPYIVVSDIVVPSGTECVIEEGVVFLFKPFTGLIVDGRILVKGTPAQPVIFTSANNFLYNVNSLQPPQPFDWNGIIIASESFGSVFNHIALSYSVYGIAAKTPNISIEKGVFFNNGQFHFTIKDNMQDVENNVPFTYISKLMESAADRDSRHIQIDDKNRKSSGPPARTIIRYTLFGTGILGTAAGIGGAVMAYNNAKNIEAMGPDKINPDTDTYYTSSDRAIQKEKQLFTRNTTGSIGAFIIALLSAGGLTLTFIF